MTYRVLVDENTSPRVADALRETGHEAVHVTDALTEGVDDERIITFAREESYAIVTHDDDFLHEPNSTTVQILYYGDDTIDSSEIATRVDEVSKLVPDQTDLPAITSLTGWSSE